MTQRLAHTMAYFCSKQGGKLPSIILAMMIYVADWKSAIERGVTITDIAWKKTEYGLPYTDDILNTAKTYSHYFSVTESNLDKEYFEISLKAMNYPFQPSPEEQETFKFVENLFYEKRTWKELSDIISSTYPMISKTTSLLNLPELAKEYVGYVLPHLNNRRVARAVG
ncbi:MAG: hypothetical protein WDO70_12490 [Alphaproteobacteria bacterium]